MGAVAMIGNGAKSAIGSGVVTAHDDEWLVGKRGRPLHDAADQTRISGTGRGGERQSEQEQCRARGAQSRRLHRQLLRGAVTAIRMPNGSHAVFGPGILESWPQVS